jgi:hypothetical protein
LVTLATNIETVLTIIEETKEMEVIYRRTFASDVFIVDFELIYDCSILVLIIEDCTTNTREVNAIDYSSGEYVHPPQQQNNNGIYSLATMFNDVLFVGYNDKVVAFKYLPRDNWFQHLNTL